jgi:hypothetical protein
MHNSPVLQATSAASAASGLANESARIAVVIIRKASQFESSPSEESEAASPLDFELAQINNAIGVVTPQQHGAEPDKHVLEVHHSGAPLASKSASWQECSAAQRSSVLSRFAAGAEVSQSQRRSLAFGSGRQSGEAVA